VIEALHAYSNYRNEVDWNTCGQAAIATILDFHHIDPFGLPRDAEGHWNDGVIIDALKADGMGPDVVFGWGTQPSRIVEALRKYGLEAHDSFFAPGVTSPGGLFEDLRGALERDLPVPVLVDLGPLNGGAFGAHWPIAFKIADGRVHLANMSVPGNWNSTPTIEDFIWAWHAWFLPYGLNWAAAYASQPDPVSWSKKDSGTLTTADSPDSIEYAIIHNVVAADAVEFHLQLVGSVTWKKVLNIPDGEGTSWDIVAEGANADASNGLWASQVKNGQFLTFSKAKFLGGSAPVLRLGDLENLSGGDRVTFRWVRD
jgi:hypothetical protein